MHNTRSRTALKHTSRKNILPHPFPIWLVAARVQPLLPNPGLHGRSARLFSSLRAILCEKKEKKEKKDQHKRESRWIKQPRCRGNYSGAKSPLKSCGGCNGLRDIYWCGTVPWHTYRAPYCLLQKYRTWNRRQSSRDGHCLPSKAIKRQDSSQCPACLMNQNQNPHRYGAL